MTNSQNLESLIAQHDALKAENEVMREALQQIANMNEMYSRIADAISIARIGLTPVVAPAVEVEAIAPKYKIGDKVRVVGKQETPPPVSDYGRGEYDTIYSVEANGGYKLSYTNGIIGTLVWFDYELAPYNDTETTMSFTFTKNAIEYTDTPKPDLSFTAHGDATSSGCKMCGNEHKSLNEQGYCSSCWTVWNS